MQGEFRFGWLVAGALLAFAVLLFRTELNRLPNRHELGRRTVPVRFEPLRVEAAGLAPFRLAGAWRVRSPDRRFGGISALALDRGGLIALSDSGVVVRFPKPTSAGSVMAVRELPAGPRDGEFKSNRDSEAIAADPGGRGWWVAFENRNELWLYDRTFDRPMRRVALGRRALGYNRGIEAMVPQGDGLILFPESGERVLRPGGKTASVSGVTGWISDAVRLPDGRLLVANRRPTAIGLSNSLLFLERAGDGYRAGTGVTLSLGRLDNIEALAAEPLPNGATRVWAMTDNNLQQHRPTLLIALELRPRPGSR